MVVFVRYFQPCPNKIPKYLNELIKPSSSANGLPGILIKRISGQMYREIKSSYLLKNILNLIPAPSNEVRTISPFAIIVFRASGKSNFIAISCPTNKR